MTRMHINIFIWHLFQNLVVHFISTWLQDPMMDCAMQRLGSFPAACSRSGADTPCLPTSLESELIWMELWRQQLEWFFDLFTSFYISCCNLLPTLTFVSLTMSHADRPWSAYSYFYPLCHDVISLSIYIYTHIIYIWYVTYVYMYMTSTYSI